MVNLLNTVKDTATILMENCIRACLKNSDMTKSEEFFRRTS